MKTETKIPALENAHSIEEVVRLVNDDFTDTQGASSEEVAGIYAFNAAIEAGYGTNNAEIEAHLDALMDSGAEFLYKEALAVAESIQTDKEKEMDNYYKIWLEDTLSSCCDEAVICAGDSDTQREVNEFLQRDGLPTVDSAKILLWEDELSEEIAGMAEKNGYILLDEVYGYEQNKIIIKIKEKI